MTGITVQPCGGSWSSLPGIIETESPDPIYVQTCNGCDEILVIFRGRSIPTGLTKNAKDHEIEAALRQYFDDLHEAVKIAAHESGANA